MLFSAQRPFHTSWGKTGGIFPTKIKYQVALPWWSSGSDSELPMQGLQVQPLVGELRSHMPELFLMCKTSNTKQECPLLLLLFNKIRQGKEIRNKNWKEGDKSNTTFM